MHSTSSTRKKRSARLHSLTLNIHGSKRTHVPMRNECRCRDRLPELLVLFLRLHIIPARAREENSRATAADLLVSLSREVPDAEPGTGKPRQRGHQHRAPLAGSFEDRRHVQGNSGDPFQDVVQGLGDERLPLFPDDAPHELHLFWARLVVLARFISAALKMRHERCPVAWLFS